MLSTTVANTQLAMIVSTSLLVILLVVDKTAVGVILILYTPTEQQVKDVLTSVMIHGNAVINSTHTNVVLDGNVIKNLVNVNQTWLEKVLALTPPVPNTATRIHPNPTCTNAILLLIHVTSAQRTRLQVVIRKLNHVKIVRPLQRVSGNVTRLTLQTQNVKNAKEALQLIARAELKLAKVAISLKRWRNVIKKH
jgi:hypothetical protein